MRRKNVCVCSNVIGLEFSAPKICLLRSADILNVTLVETMPHLTDERFSCQKKHSVFAAI